MFTSGRILLGLVAFTTCIGGYVADWNETHIYNPRWTPHAKFHNGQTLSTGVLLGLTSLYYLFYFPSSSKSRQNSPAVQRERERVSLYIASWMATLNWVSQLSAVLYPGSLPVDPEFGGGFPQAYICALLLSIVAAGTLLEHRRLRKVEKMQ